LSFTDLAHAWLGEACQGQTLNFSDEEVL